MDNATLYTRFLTEFVNFEKEGAFRFDEARVSNMSACGRLNERVFNAIFQREFSKQYGTTSQPYTDAPASIPVLGMNGQFNLLVGQQGQNWALMHAYEERVHAPLSVARLAWGIQNSIYRWSDPETQVGLERELKAAKLL